MNKINFSYHKIYFGIIRKRNNQIKNRKIRFLSGCGFLIIYRLYIYSHYG